ncbi:MAG TPA: porin, partial [Blastocatellia bacterium]|nr:porin [Blastocatellia bacterium]
RVEELESKVVKASADTTESVKEVKEVKADVATIQDAKKEEDKAISPIMAFLKATEISGFVDGYYSYSFNRPDGDLQLRNFDTKHNQFSLNLAKLVLEKKPTPDSRLGFRTDFAYGPTTEIVHASEPGGTNVFHNIEQAYVSYLAPVGKGLQLDFGKFVTWDGAEVIETKDNWNYSRSLLFALAIPYYHFGLRAVYPVSPKLTLSGYLVNGWNDVVANNHRKTFGFTAAWNPTPKLSIVQNYTGGATQPNDNKDVRHLYDTTVTYTVNPIISLMANYDYGKDAVDGRGVHWQGVAGYFKAQVNKWWALIPRFEWYDDHDGFTTGLAQTLKEITLTSEQKIYGNLLTRLEYRRDFSDENFFNKPIGRLVPAQSNVLFGIVYAFSSHSE